MDEKEAEMIEHELDRGIADYRGWIEAQYDLPRQRDEMVSHIKDYLFFTDEVLKRWFRKPKCTRRGCVNCDPRQWIRQVEHAGCAMLFAQLPRTVGHREGAIHPPVLTRELGRRWAQHPCRSGE
jgi:hypothetical protein